LDPTQRMDLERLGEVLTPLRALIVFGLNKLGRQIAGELKEGLNALTGIDSFWTCSKKHTRTYRFTAVLTPLRALIVFGL